MAGYSNQIWVILHSDGSLTIRDNGHGISLNHIKPILSELHSGGKFGIIRTYRVSGGLHGVGLNCVSALSEWMKTTVWQAGREVVVRTERGELVSERESAFDGPSGTQIRFKPDPEIFSTTGWSVERLLANLRQQAFLYPQLTVTFTDESKGCDPQVMNFPGGISEWARENVAVRRPVHPNVIAGTGTQDGVEAEVAFFFTQDEPVWRVFGNGVELPDAGTPLTGFRQAVSRTIGTWARKSGRDFEPCKAGLGVAVVLSVRVPYPQFEGPTKNRLGNPEAASAVWAVTAAAIEAHFVRHPDEAEAILSGMLRQEGV
ncbi:ATP-binding protein [Armatimonas sp.]|uniref:ATP-binding protein n=1 Tax=Armatimonas sp. TaxID=1872638 RepID=UPI00286C6C6B|nr:ATP-binding protein [Armatimonas sp.]